MLWTSRSHRLRACLKGCKGELGKIERLVGSIWRRQKTRKILRGNSRMGDWKGMGKEMRVGDLCGDGKRAVGQSISRAHVKAVWTRFEG